MHILLVEDLKLNQYILRLEKLPGVSKLIIKEAFKHYTICMLNVKQEKVLKYTISHVEIQKCVDDFIND